MAYLGNNKMLFMVDYVVMKAEQILNPLKPVM